MNKVVSFPNKNQITKKERENISSIMKQADQEAEYINRYLSGNAENKLMENYGRNLFDDTISSLMSENLFK